ncbi:uncharacterized protein LOC134220838 isoform X2 [Armigeres subalbatus]|uniref:uncharacterized protein LOC134220838 isoform X2 n=1 Tax=Armigeres subalbatus TaxID=124917 RepID=UPI002ED533ED
MLQVKFIVKVNIIECVQIFSKLYTYKRHVKNHQFDRPTENIQNETDETVGKLPCELQQMDMHKENTSNDIDNDRSINKLEANILHIRQAAVEFTLKIHDRSNITRQDVRNIQNATQQFCLNAVQKLETLIVPQNPQIQYEIDKYLNEMKNPFEFINTDFKFFGELKELGLFEHPSILALEEDKITSVSFVEGRKSCLVLNPIEFQVRSFFETGDVLKKTVENTSHYDQLANNAHFVNGHIWGNIKTKYCEQNLKQNINYILPIWLYADEFEINDPLSSHNKTDSVCGIYYSFPTVPDDYKSKLCNIFVAGVIRKVAISNVGVNSFISKLIKPFKRLEEEGIVINLQSGQVKIRFVLSLLQGDNLGVHTLLFLSSGFNATYYCRFCRRHKTQMQTDFESHEDFARNRQNYSLDVNTKKHSLTGISGPSAFNDLPSFHVVENLSVDPMHDLFSTGICKYGFVAALSNFIYVKKYFNISKLNMRKIAVSRISCDIALRRMPDIEEGYDKKRKCKLVSIRSTAAEMKAFCFNFSIIVGPLVPNNDPVWEYCTVLINLIDLILSKTFSEEDLLRMQNLIQQHHTLYINLFGDTLKPKHHFITHYPKVIQKYGPVERMMCFRNEARHKGLKEYAHAMSSRTNIAYSLCIKTCLQFSNSLYNKMFFKFENNDNFQIQDIRSRLYFNKIAANWPFDLNDDIKLAHSVIFNGIEFKIENCVVQVDNLDIRLYEIEEFACCKDQLYAVCRIWKVGNYIEHYLAYEAIERCGDMCVIELSSIKGPPFSIHEVNNTFVFRFRKSF